MWADSCARIVGYTALTCVLFWPYPGLAQQSDTEPDEERGHVGAFSFTPGVVFSSGYDTNITREVPPIRGVDTYVVPQAEILWRVGQLRVAAAAAQEFVRGTRGLNYRTDATVEYHGPIFEPSITYEQPRTNARPTGFEIGKKSRRVEDRLHTQLRTKITPRSMINVAYTSVTIAYDADAIYESSSLREKLNRTTRAVSGGYSYILTPLTSFDVSAEFEHDEFRYSLLRNGDSRTITGGVNFGRSALFTGNASVGYKVFVSPFSGAASFSGVVAFSQLSYAARDGILIFRLNRDLQYSYDASLAYYLLTNAALSYTRTVVGPWRVLAYADGGLLDYRHAATITSNGRVDHFSDFGGALAFQLSKWSRIGVSAELYAKYGSQPFAGSRIVGFITYGKHFERLDRPIPLEH